MSGLEWMVEAHGCDPGALTDMPRLHALFAQMVADLGLRPVGEAQWHQFPAPAAGEAGGITGLCLLAESHLAVHTFPEHRSLCLNLFCCRPRPEWDFAGYLSRNFAAEHVEVRRMERAYSAQDAFSRPGSAR